MIEIKVLDQSNWDSYSSELQKLESLAEYPYGSDYFRIDHGNSYFSFFERLGTPKIHIALNGQQIVACAAGIIRKIPVQGKLITAWYLCDLKVHPNFRRQRIPSQLFKRQLLFNYFKCSRAYAVSMNPINQRNRVVDITSKLPLFPIQFNEVLNIYSLSFEEMNLISSALISLVGPISYLSLNTKKDLIMKSTGIPMKVLHVQHGPLAEFQKDSPVPNFTHMLCAPNHSPLDKLMKTHFKPVTTASIIAYRMKKVDWSFILTSDI